MTIMLTVIGIALVFSIMAIDEGKWMVFWTLALVFSFCLSFALWQGFTFHLNERSWHVKLDIDPFPIPKYGVYDNRLKICRP